MGNRRVFKEDSEDSLADSTGRGLTGACGEQNSTESEKWFADNEEDSNSSRLTYDRPPTVALAICRRCKSEVNTKTTYCRNCYNARTSWMPSRPTRKLRGKVALREVDEDGLPAPTPRLSAISHLRWMKSADAELLSSSAEEFDYEKDRKEARRKRREYIRKMMADDDSGTETSDSTSYCMRCHVRPLEAVLVHEKAAHLCVCTICANYLESRKQPCPYCQKKIQFFVSGRIREKDIQLS